MEVIRSGAAAAWEGKVELAMHTGNVGSGPRKRLAAVAKANPQATSVAAYPRAEPCAL